jgi:phage replication O-like protein O
MVAMANPQKEDGYTAIANELMEAIIAAPLGGGQVRLLLHLLRQSYGYNRKTATLGAGDFAAATGLHPKVIARELRDLEARGVIVVFREEGKRSTYSFQKDYSRWQTGNLLVPGSDPEPESTRNQKVPGPGTETFPPPEPKGTRSIYKELKDNSKDNFKDKTTPNGVAASGTLRQRFESDYRAAPNGSKRIAVCARYFEQMLGPPNFGRVGQLLKDAGSGGALFSAMQEASKQTLTDDPHDYVATVLRNGGVRATHTGRSGKTPPGTNVGGSWRAEIERRKW